MHADDIVFTRKHPITGHISTTVWYAAVDEAVVVLVAQDRGQTEFALMLTPEHLTTEARHGQARSDRALQPLWWLRNRESEADAKEAARQLLGADPRFTHPVFGEAREVFQQALEAWQLLEVDTAKLAAPYRLVRSSPTHLMAVANNPAAHVAPMSDGTKWPDGTPKLNGSAVLAKATKHTRAETEGRLSGWYVTVGHDTFAAGSRREHAIEEIRLALDDTFALTGIPAEKQP